MTWAARAPKKPKTVSKMHSLAMSYGLEPRFLAMSMAVPTPRHTPIKMQNAYCRIIVERGDCSKVNNVLDSIMVLLKDNITEVRIKDGWELLYKNPNINLNIIDMSFVPFHSGQPWWQEWKNIFKYPIKRWVKKHKTKLTKEQIEDPNTVYFVDYYQYYI